MKIVFLGEDSFSALALESLIIKKYQILGVFCPLKNKNNNERLKFLCDKNNIRFHLVKDINSVVNESIISQYVPDLVVVAHFSKLLKSNIFEIPKYGTINVHPSLLPFYRGLSPIQRPIINGDAKTGVTVHFIAKGIDTGDIITQKELKIKKNMYVSQLQKEIFETYKYIIIDAIQIIKSAKKEYLKQGHLKGSYYKILKEEDCIIDIEGGYLNSLNLIRGVSIPYFGAQFGDYRIWSAKILTNEEVKIASKKYKQNGLYEVTEIGPILKFNDGYLSIDKMSKIL